MENTLENKTKFFAQYWGQNVWCNERYKNLDICTESFFQDNINSKAYLDLKPLSSIRDEEAKKLGYLNSINLLNKNKGTNEFYTNESDYLRSKGYALDWNGITVEEQIELGWVKLKQ